jgi:integrase
VSVRKRIWITSSGEAKEAWVVDYTDQEGDRHVTTFARKRDADAHHDKVRIDVRKGMHIAPSKSITVAEAAETWIKRAEAKGRERATVKQYREHVDLHIVPEIGDIKFAQLTPERVEGFRDKLLVKLSRPLAKKVWQSFRSILRVAKFAHVSDDISIDSKRERKLEVGRDIPTPTEVKRLIKATDGNIRQRVLLLTMTLTGLRASELRGLRWSDVDLNANKLHVRQRADCFNTIGAPKSKSSVRTIPLDTELLVPILKREWQLACPKGDLALVFPTKKGKVEQHATMLKRLGKVMLVAGVVKKNEKGELVPKYAMHAFRHFYASWCINAKSKGGRELPAKEVQCLLGHASISETLDTYGHLFPTSEDRAELNASVRALFA